MPVGGCTVPVGGCDVAVGGSDVEVGPVVAVGAPGIVGVGVGAGVLGGGGVNVGSPGRKVRVFVGVCVGKKVPPAGVGVGLGVNEGVELGPPPAMLVASTAASTAE